GVRRRTPGESRVVSLFIRLKNCAPERGGCQEAEESLEIETLNHWAIEFDVSIMECLMECLNDSMTESLCYNHFRPGWRYRLGVRTEDSQSSNPGSIPGSATISN